MHRWCVWKHPDNDYYEVDNFPADQIIAMEGFLMCPSMMIGINPNAVHCIDIIEAETQEEARHIASEKYAPIEVYSL